MYAPIYQNSVKISSQHLVYGKKSKDSTLQYFTNKVHISSKCFNVLQAGNGPDWNKLVTVHLWYQV